MIDFSALPAPQVIEALDFEVLLQQRKDELIAVNADYADVLAVESEPLTKWLENHVYRELLLRQRINDSSAALLLPKATGADLDHIAATYYRINRLLIDAGDAAAVPPLPAVYESDERLRERCRLTLYANNTAGSKGAYKFHAMTAAASIKDVFVGKHTPQAGDVTLTVLSSIAEGTPTQAMLDSVQSALDAEGTRPLNDTVFVQAATIVNYTLDATLICYPDTNTSVVLEQANANASTYVADHHALGHDITLAAIHAALVVPGVSDVVINAPANNIVIANHEVAYNTAIIISLGASNA